jgi:hypothetical protein
MIHQATGLPMTLFYTIIYADGKQEVVFILEDAQHIPLRNKEETL